MLLAHHTLVGIRSEIWWGRVCMCRTTNFILCVEWAHGSLVAHDHNPPYSSRRIKCGSFVTFVILMETNP